MTFDPRKDKIAITIPELTLYKESLGEGPDPLIEIWHDGIYNEPYFVSLAIDSHGTHQNSLEFNYTEFPKIRKGESVKLIGDGALVYGPKNPGDFVSVAVAVLERDQEIRDFGKFLKDVIESKAAELSLKAFLAANPGATAVANILKEVLRLVASAIMQNKDDYLLRVDGTFFRDKPVPYEINRRFHRANEYIGVDLQVIPLSAPNGQGPTTKAIQL